MRIFNRTKILTVILVAVIIVFAYLIARNYIFAPQEEVFMPEAEESMGAWVFFDEQLLMVSPEEENSISVNIEADSGDSAISGVQVELMYDPEVIGNVVLSPVLDEAGFFGPNVAVLFNEVDEEAGTISFAVAISAGENPVRNSGIIANLTFERINPNVSITDIKFVEGTVVTTIDGSESILERVLPLDIVFD